MYHAHYASQLSVKWLKAEVTTPERHTSENSYCQQQSVLTLDGASYIAILTRDFKRNNNRTSTTASAAVLAKSLAVIIDYH